jgi:alkylation response protein AidB-like acyl-CoA dehydrogenase
VADLIESPEQTELRTTLRRLFGGPSSCLARPALDGAEQYDAALWSKLAGEIGLPGLSIPERYGGSGYSRADRAAALHEMGRCLLPSPFLASAVLAAETLLATDDEEVLADVLPGLAAGTTWATVAYRDGPGADCPPVRAARDGMCWLLTGSRSFVLDGCQADLLLVPADTGSGIGLFLIDVAAPGLSRRPMRTLDPTRPQAWLDLSATPGRLVGEPGAGNLALRKGVAHAVIALAAEQVGGAERCLEAAVEYAGTRQQFGRLIGSFQAIKHKCADLLIEVESARSAARYAASVSSGPVVDEDLYAAAAIAGAYCSAAFFTVAAENIQIHGGIGFTWEHDAHLYFRRAKASEAMLGTPLGHRAFLARHLGLSGSLQAPPDLSIKLTNARRGAAWRRNRWPSASLTRRPRCR